MNDEKQDLPPESLPEPPEPSSAIKEENLGGELKTLAVIAVIIIVSAVIYALGRGTGIDRGKDMTMQDVARPTIRALTEERDQANARADENARSLTAVVEIRDAFEEQLKGLEDEASSLLNAKLILQDDVAYLAGKVNEFEAQIQPFPTVPLRYEIENGLGIDFSDGAWLVGIDIARGVYKNTDQPFRYDDQGRPISSCSWYLYNSFDTSWRTERRSGRNALFNIVEIKFGDRVFISGFCGRWVLMDTS